MHTDDPTGDGPPPLPSAETVAAYQATDDFADNERAQHRLLASIEAAGLPTSNTAGSA